MMSTDLTPVLEIGGTHVTAALVDPAAAHVPAGTVRREPLAADAPAEDIVKTLLDCANTLPAPPGAPWAVAVPGPFDYEAGIALFTGVGKFDALHGTDLRSALLRGVTARPSRIGFLNDAHAYALGEWTAGAAVGHARTVGVTLGTGVGSAFLESGSLVTHGADVPPQGHAHLLTVDGRPLEDTVSRRAILHRYAEETGEPHHGETGVDVSTIAALARDGDAPARTVFDQAFTALGRALRPWLDRFHADVMVVGGSVAQSWDVVRDPLRTGLEQGTPGRPLRTRVVAGRRLHDAALLGAAWHARHRAAGRGAHDAAESSEHPAAENGAMTPHVQHRRPEPAAGREEAGGGSV